MKVVVILFSVNSGRDAGKRLWDVRYFTYDPATMTPTNPESHSPWRGDGVYAPFSLHWNEWKLEMTSGGFVWIVLLREGKTFAILLGLVHIMIYNPCFILFFCFELSFALPKLVIDSIRMKEGNRFSSSCRDLILFFTKDIGWENRINEHLCEQALGMESPLSSAP